MPTRSDVIAERTLYRQIEGGSWRAVHIRFERPRERPTGEWGCRYSVEGFEQSARSANAVIFGVDAVQAFELAKRVVDGMLMHSRAFAEGRLAWSPESRPHQLEDFEGPMPPTDLARDPIARSELVRTVELALDWPLPSVLRVEVLARPLAPGKLGYWTRVWRSDTYRFTTTASASVRGARLRNADETILVEDLVFSSQGGVLEQTPEAAVEATVRKIRWQLFAETAPRPGDTRRRGRRASKKR